MAEVIGGNNPPDDQRIVMLSPAEEVEKSLAGTIKDLSDRAQALLDTASRVPKDITDDTVYDKVVALVAAFREIEDEREKKRKANKDPYLKASQVVDGAFKLTNDEGQDRSKNMANEIASLTARLSAYDTAKYEEAAKQAVAEAASLSEQASSDGIIIPAGEVDVKLESRKSEYGGLSTKSVVNDWEIEDESKLPRSVLSPDPKKIKALVEKGATIPGVKITKRVETVVKRK